MTIFIIIAWANLPYAWILSKACVNYKWMDTGETDVWVAVSIPQLLCQSLHQPW